MGRTVYIDDGENPLILPQGEWAVAEIHDDGRRKWATLKTWSEMVEWERRSKGLTHYVGVVDRPGVKVWSNLLETRYFWPPGSPRNDVFTLHEGIWEDVRWQIVSIPRRLQRFADRAAEMTGLAIKELVPLVIRGDDLPPEDVVSFERARRHGKFFPMRGKDVRCLEYRPDLARMINMVGTGFALRAEDAWVDRNTARANVASRGN